MPQAAVAGLEWDRGLVPVVGLAVGFEFDVDVVFVEAILVEGRPSMLGWSTGADGGTLMRSPSECSTHGRYS